MSLGNKPSEKANPMKASLIAPCGMNCRLCRAYVREKKACPGCSGNNRFKSKSCAQCRIKNCGILRAGEFKFCFSCGEYPCDRLRHLDKRYRTKYGMSMLENLENIKSLGIRSFVNRERERWACPKCGELLCVHKEYCLSCGRRWIRYEKQF